MGSNTSGFTKTEPALPFSGEIELCLQIHPKLGFDTEPVSETQGNIVGDGASARDDLIDSIRRHPDLTGEDG